MARNTPHGGPGPSHECPRGDTVAPHAPGLTPDRSSTRGSSCAAATRCRSSRSSSARIREDLPVTAPALRKALSERPATYDAGQAGSVARFPRTSGRRRRETSTRHFLEGPSLGRLVAAAAPEFVAAATAP